MYLSDVEASEAPAFDVVLKADKKRLQLLEEVSINKWINETCHLIVQSCSNSDIYSIHLLQEAHLVALSENGEETATEKLKEVQVDYLILTLFV